MPMLALDRIDYSEWYLSLRVDASRCGKLHTVENMSRHILELFWQKGAEPSVLGLINAAENF